MLPSALVKRARDGKKPSVYWRKPWTSVPRFVVLGSVFLNSLGRKIFAEDLPSQMFLNCRGLKGTRVTYNACISACRSAWTWALWLFGQMRMQGRTLIVFLNDLYLCILDAAADDEEDGWMEWWRDLIWFDLVWFELIDWLIDCFIHWLIDWWLMMFRIRSRSHIFQCRHDCLRERQPMAAGATGGTLWPSKLRWFEVP